MVLWYVHVCTYVHVTCITGAAVIEFREYGEYAYEIASFWLVNVSSNSKQIAIWLSILVSE